MSQCDRIRLILRENGLKQKQLASDLAITEGYVSQLLKDPSIRLSQSLATLIEEKYGYSAEWIRSGAEPKFKQISKTKGLSELQQKALTLLEKMNDKQILAVLAFIDSLDKVERLFADRDE